MVDWILKAFSLFVVWTSANFCKRNIDMESNMELPLPVHKLLKFVCALENKAD